MKSTTIINKIKSEQMCSISTAKLLTKALQREEKLPINMVIRFRPLQRDFDIINADFYNTGEFNRKLCHYIGTVENLEMLFS